MEKFFNWFRTYEVEITWCIVGFLTSSALVSLGRGEWKTALLYFVIVAVNIFIYKKKSNVAE